MRKLGVPGLLAGLLVISGCAATQTYLSEKGDLQSGNQGVSRRVAAAQTKLQAAQDQQASLREDEASAQEELTAAQADLASVNANLRSQTARLARARSQGTISPADETAQRQQLEQATQDFQDASLQLESGRAAGNAALVREKQQELARLKREIEAMNEEIAILAP